VRGNPLEDRGDGKVDLSEISCEDGMWMELAQDHGDVEPSG